MSQGAGVLASLSRFRLSDNVANLFYPVPLRESCRRDVTNMDVIDIDIVWRAVVGIR